MSKKRKKPYNERSLLEKILVQWKKINGLLLSSEWSSAVVRAATASELAATFAIRNEISSRSSKDNGFSDHFIDSLLIWANGLNGKIEKILKPMIYGQQHYNDLRKLFTLAQRINAKRNKIAHTGEFANKKEAVALIEDCRVFVTGVVSHYEDGFELPELVGLDAGDE